MTNIFKDDDIIQQEITYFKNSENDTEKPCVALITNGNEVILTQEELLEVIKYMDSM